MQKHSCKWTACIAVGSMSLTGHDAGPRSQRARAGETPLDWGSTAHRRIGLQKGRSSVRSPLPILTSLVLEPSSSAPDSEACSKSGSVLLLLLQCPTKCPSPQRHASGFLPPPAQALNLPVIDAALFNEVWGTCHMAKASNATAGLMMPCLNARTKAQCPGELCQWTQSACSINYSAFMRKAASQGIWYNPSTPFGRAMARAAAACARGPNAASCSRIAL